MKWNPLNTKVGLALGGGAAKGLAHVGVLKAFEEEGVAISYLSGTSIGALVAAYYAFGKPIEDIMAIGEDLHVTKVINFTLKKRGFFSTDSLRAMILRDLGDVQIENARIPLAICTTDIVTGERVTFEKGSLADAICASAAVPGLFVPVEIEGRMLVDGGIVENVPVSVLEDMGAGIIVAVDLNGVKKYGTPNDVMDVITNAIDIGMDLRTRDQLKSADIVLSLDLSKYSRAGNADNAWPLFMEGYWPMKAKIKRLLWYKRTNYLLYLLKALRELVPLKIPDIIKNLYKQKWPSIKIK
ncbi:MAG: patatin-like phospholipase family protein [Hahellaceae bacterium]|nr:patatin-like phospholipase family protein [Hahellaceae bacterium]MCP5169812.1 patatin-like phospholipase family protein [Hahellaceae bacterium]